MTNLRQNRFELADLLLAGYSHCQVAVLECLQSQAGLLSKKLSKAEQINRKYGAHQNRLDEVSFHWI